VIHHGDCLDVLPTLDADSVDAVVTDPPYHLTEMSKRWAGTAAGTRMPGAPPFNRHTAGFMGKAWDGGGVAFDPATWAAVLRVAKPGAHLVAFGGSRTYHRLACAIEDAGWEIRDCLVWLYGSGFPKSLDVSKAIDKAAGVEREVLRPSHRHGGGVVGNGSSYELPPSVPMVTSPATDDARRWQGWGTALKPAMEPIVLARKPVSERSIAANVLRWGTGAINVDGCRIGTDWGTDPTRRGWQGRHLRHEGGAVPFVDYNKELSQPHEAGRWPANVLLSHAEECRPVGTHTVRSGARDGSDRRGGFGNVGASDVGSTAPSPLAPDGRELIVTWECVEDCAVRQLDEQSGERTSGLMHPTRPSTGQRRVYGKDAAAGWTTMETYGDTGGASRFFYTSKASTAERLGGNRGRGEAEHPTVKPMALMSWLVRLVTPPGGLVLDPFLGSGTTAIACIGQGFRWLGIERDAGYVEIAVQRIGLAAR
jgi:DNA modification methylase